jgi:hypothetical protein
MDALAASRSLTVVVSASSIGAAKGGGYARYLAAQITQERYTHALPGQLEQVRAQFDRWPTDVGSQVATADN